MMTTDYNQIAGQYKRAKEHAWRSRIEMFSMMNLIGDLRGKKVIDIACGEGHFTRKLRLAGAATTTGIDISDGMIELARRQEADQPLGIDYLVEDARLLAPQQDFDLAVAAWLLVYAHDRAELDRMCQGLSRRLRPGGRFVTIVNNPDLFTFQRPDYRKYGFDVELADQAFDGAPITWTVFLEGSSITIENYHLPIAAYESAFHDAGFRDFAVHRLELSPNPDGTDDREFWKDFLRWPPAILMDCVKG